MTLAIERTLGGLEIFLPYVRDYVNTFSGKSITTWEWKDHLYAYWAKVSTEKVKALDSIDWDAWLHGEGLELPVKIEYDTSLAEAAYSLASKWDQSRDKPVDALDFKEDDLKDFNANQISECFLQPIGRHSQHFQSSSWRNYNSIPRFRLPISNILGNSTSSRVPPTQKSVCGSTRSPCLTQRPHLPLSLPRKLQNGLLVMMELG